ncbi:MAG: hypothetical protein HY726_01890 [Candidatus Rokubacteria bacterium]|nr:hypothetical protein [Candidatus Rokubacteria bacterium]
MAAPGARAVPGLRWLRAHPGDVVSALKRELAVVREGRQGLLNILSQRAP